MYQGVIRDTSNDAKKFSRNTAMTNIMGIGKKASSLSDCSLSSSSSSIANLTFSSSSSSSSSAMTALRYFKQKEDVNEDNRQRLAKNNHRGEGETDDDQEYEENYDPYDEQSSELNTSSKYLHLNSFYDNIQVPALKCSPFFESPISNSQIQYDCSAPIARNTPENNEVKLIEYRKNKMAAFRVDGKEMICLPQAFEIFLKNLVGGLHTVYTKLKRLDIVPVICNVEQVRVLRQLGAIQSGVNRCKLISPSEFDTLYEDCTNSGSRPGRPPKRHPLERENHSPNQINSNVALKFNKNNDNNNNINENCLTKSEPKKKSANETTQKQEMSKNHSNQNSKFNINEGINIRMENTMVSSSPTSTSPFSSFTNSSSSSSSSSSSEDNFINMKHKNQKNIQNQNQETDCEYNPHILGMAPLPFSLLNSREKFHAQLMGSQTEKKIIEDYNTKLNNMFPYSMSKFATNTNTNAMPSPYSSFYSKENSVLSKSSQPLIENNSLNSQQSNPFNSSAAAAAAFALYGMLPSNFMFHTPDGQTNQPFNINSFSSNSPRASIENISTTESDIIDQNRCGKNGLSMFSAFSSPTSSNFHDISLIQKIYNSAYKPNEKLETGHQKSHEYFFTDTKEKRLDKYRTNNNLDITPKKAKTSEENCKSESSLTENIKSNNETLSHKKFHPLSIEYLTGKNFDSKKKSSDNLEKKLDSNEDSNNSVRKQESIPNICSLIDSIKINFFKLENTLQNEIENLNSSLNKEKTLLTKSKKRIHVLKNFQRNLQYKLKVQHSIIFKRDSKRQQMKRKIRSNFKNEMKSNDIFIKKI